MEQVIQYPSELQKCCSIVPRSSIGKASKKSLTSCPLSVATCLPAVKLVCFQYFLIGGWLFGRLSFICDCFMTTAVYTSTIPVRKGQLFERIRYRSAVGQHYQNADLCGQRPKRRAIRFFIQSLHAQPDCFFRVFFFHPCDGRLF